MNLNVKELRNKHGLSQADLAKMTGIDKGRINNWEQGKGKPKVQDYNTLISFFKSLDKSISRETGPNGAHLMISEEMSVPLVNQYAYAGYMSGFSDNEYIESLQKITWQVEREGKGNYICFEVRGESMDDGGRGSLLPGDVVLAREIQRHLWHSRFHTKRYKKFVIVHRTEGILIKEIREHDVENNTITVHSLNPEFEDRVLNLDDIAQIFNVVKTQINE